MVSVLTLHYELELLLNRIHSGYSKDASAVDLDALLNNAKDILLERSAEIAEKNTTLESQIRNLEQLDIPLKSVSKSDLYDTFALPVDYYRSLRLDVRACTKDCPDPDIDEIVTKTWVQLDDLDELLKHPFKQPNWNWRRGAYNIASKGLVFYHKKAYEVKGIKLSYIKYIPNVAAPSLVKEGKYLASDRITVITDDLHLDLPEKGTLWRLVVQIAGYLYKKSVDDNYKVELESILFNQNIGIG